VPFYVDVLTELISDGTFVLSHETNVTLYDNKNQGGNAMFTKQRVVILMIVIVTAIILGRLAVRFAINIMIGGTMFGGNIL
jgi:hypothetical protein